MGRTPKPPNGAVIMSEGEFQPNERTIRIVSESLKLLDDEEE